MVDNFVVVDVVVVVAVASGLMDYSEDAFVLSRLNSALNPWDAAVFSINSSMDNSGDKCFEKTYFYLFIAIAILFLSASFLWCYNLVRLFYLTQNINNEYF